jgi:pimeloyl-ACP methyl ester carboxylesterase
MDRPREERVGEHASTYSIGKECERLARANKCRSLFGENGKMPVGLTNRSNRMLRYAITKESIRLDSANLKSRRFPMDQPEQINHTRRRLFGAAAGAIAAAQFVGISSGKAQSDATEQSLPSPLGSSASFAALKYVDAGLLNVAYAEAGPSDGPAVILLHGWPYDIHSFVDVAPLLAAAGYRVIVPYLRGYGTTRFLSSETMRNAQQSAVALDVIALMDALRIQTATVGGFDWGGRTADVMATLWPERCKAIVSVSGYLISTPAGNQVPLPPEPAFQFWYQYYFATPMGKAGYAKYLAQFNKFIWHQASPKWNFDDATYDRSAASFNNPDHVDIVMHDYRWRLGLADGERKYDDLEKRLAAFPPITVPTITMEGDTNGAIHAPSAAYRNRFSGKYDYRLITGGVGHNLPQEAPEAFAKAIIDVDKM